jgi:malonate-semialdehyde dehydrogenase (acetylating) / methylmalonate-semialdehyde dehydrogenase
MIIYIIIFLLLINYIKFNIYYIMKGLQKIKKSVPHKFQFSSFSTKVNTLKNFINGEFVESKGTKFYDIINPATNELISNVPESTKEEFDYAVASAKSAFKKWKDVPLLSRQRYMFDFLRLLRERQVKILYLIFI